ncbi:Pentatricopeptide repeat-containing protein MRL1, chloroplastic [Dichanthelium oligosanthes]|uniref:Pentatricopeptide repeat-containing protein MRL1, chloroplastic n=1 Tax=Dichanthelium oligosanthes TaxID=888268 RepID=A0A1E5VLD5_9POAL|nr:Pentatricopeptide repeat-containing protein MRL1, chloroplastic [Dichanthelium oligosanthes]
MEASASASAPAVLLPLLAAPPRFLHLSLRRHSTRRHGCGSGLLVQPPLLGTCSRARCRTTCCASNPDQADVLLAGASLVSVAAFTLLAALQLVWLRRRSAMHRNSPEVLHEHGKSIGNKVLGESKTMYDSNFATRATHDSGLSELGVSGRMTVDEMLCKPGIFPSVNTVHKKTQAYSVITLTSPVTSVDISGPEEVSCSIPTANCSIEKFTDVPVMPDSVSEGQNKTKYFSNSMGWVAGLPYQFLSLSGHQEVVQNSQDHTGKQMDAWDANSVGCHQSDHKEHLDFTSLSSFKRIAEDHPNFVPLASNHDLFEPRKGIEFTKSNAGSSYLPAGHFAPVACLREGPVSKQEKAVKDHDGAPVTGWSISNVLNKENPDNFAQAKRGGLKVTKDTLDYSKIYNSFLIDGRLKDCVDLLESMEQNGFLDMKKVNYLSNSLMVFYIFEANEQIEDPPCQLFQYVTMEYVLVFTFTGALQVMEVLKEAGLKPDCKLYTTLISTCAKCGKVDAMFEVFHEMVSAGIEPNVNTYSALIDGCARAGQVAKAFGAYGIMSSKVILFCLMRFMLDKVKPDRVVFNALISACGESGAVARAFDVLSEMTAESSELKGSRPILPDHVTVGALMKTCIQAGQADRAREVYKMLQEYNIKGTPEVYTIALRSCSLTGDLGFALKIYEDMNKIGVKPDEMFLSALVDVAGHATRADAAFEIMKDARAKGDGDQVLKAVDVLNEMNKIGVCPNEITYSVLFVACERNGEAQLGLNLFEQLKIDGIGINPTIIGSLTGKVISPFFLLLTSSAITVYREAVSTGLVPSSDVLSQVLGCLRLPHDNSLKSSFIENMGISCDIPHNPNINSLFEGFGEYDTRAFSIMEEAASLGAVASISMKDTRIVIDARKLKIHTAAVLLLLAISHVRETSLTSFNLNKIEGFTSYNIEIFEASTRCSFWKRLISIVVYRIGQAVGSLLRRLGISYQGEESHGRMRINGLTLRRWFNPKFNSTSSCATPADLLPLSSRLAKGIADQQRDIRCLSLE